MRKLQLGLLLLTVTVTTAALAQDVAQITRPMLADGANVPKPISYSPMDGKSIPSGSAARTNKLRMTCYPAGGECTKNSDCCTGFCRAGRVAAYCDNP
jgi:hypothetical protein